MKKRLYIIILGCMLAIQGMSGCTKNDILEKKENYQAIIPQVKEDFFYVITDSVDYKFTKNSFCNTVFLTFVSSKKYDDSDVKITFDREIGVQYGLYYLDDDEEIYDSVLLTYQGIDWNIMADYCRDEQYEMAEKYENQYYSIIDGIEKREISKLYSGSISISFDQITDLKECLNKLKVEVDGNEQIIDVNIAYEDVEVFENNYDLVYPQVLALTDVNLFHFGKKENVISNLSFDINADIKLDNIYFYRNDIDISSIQVVDRNTSMNYLWDVNEPLLITESGTYDIRINIEGDFTKKLETFNDYLILEYTKNDNKYFVTVDCVFRNRLGAWEMYAEYVDGLDYVEYYDDYINVINCESEI